MVFQILADRSVEVANALEFYKFWLTDVTGLMRPFNVLAADSQDLFADQYLTSLSAPPVITVSPFAKNDTALTPPSWALIYARLVVGIPPF